MQRTGTYRILDRVARFGRDETGSATIVAICFLMMFVVVGGIAVDFNRSISDRTSLQITADTAAHAALYTREKKGVEEAKQMALETIDNMLPAAGFGENAVTHSDVEFGVWDSQTATFVADPGANSAVRVTAQMTQDRGNPSRNLLLQVIGQDTFDIAVTSTYSTYFPPCFTEGFVAEEVVDIQSNNSFSDGFCIHSNDYVSLNQNNFFEPGTIVSMPNLDRLDMPKSGFERNEGLQTALRSGKYRLRLLSQLPDMIDSFWGGSGKYLPDFVDAGAVFDVPFGNDRLPDGTLAGSSLTPQHFEPNAVNRHSCGTSGKITMEAGTYSEFLFITDCEVKFANGVILEDVVVATTNTSAMSLNSPSGLSVGRDDNCGTGGGAVLMTMGGFNAAASLSVYGGQILAVGDIQFAANADGIQGASFQAKGRIEGTSNMNMGFCDYDGMETAYRAPYFRMVN